MGSHTQAEASLLAVECAICNGTGWVIKEPAKGHREAARCACQQALVASANLRRASIPERFAHCDFDNFLPNYAGVNASLSRAKKEVLDFSQSYPLERTGVLLTGTIGTGKTHLAIAALKYLITEVNAVGLYCDYGDLIQSLRDSNSQNSGTTETQILQPILTAEVLLLDELGAANPSDYAFEKIRTIVQARYNRNLTTIFTTNYPNLPPGGGAKGEATLGDRIAERVRSRIVEMCSHVDMQGSDYRQNGPKKGRTTSSRMIEPVQDHPVAPSKPATRKKVQGVR
jgi:DNA replication protein DnaC